MGDNTRGVGDLTGYTDADWASDRSNFNQRSLMSGFALLHSGGTIYIVNVDTIKIELRLPQQHAGYIITAEALKELV